MPRRKIVSLINDGMTTDYDELAMDYDDYG